MDTFNATVEKNARNQALFREVNEHIAELAAEWRQPVGASFVCECSDSDCTEPLDLTPAEYERVRADGARFVICPGHQLPDLERVVEGNRRYLVVEKFGPAAEIARAADPRQHA